jgi:hypothetical protein
MGSLTDPVYINITTHSHNADGTSRNDMFRYTTTLTNFVTDIPNNMATPLYNQVVAERSNPGSLVGTFTSGEPYLGGTAASMSCDLRLELGIGFQAGATPLRFHFIYQSMYSDNLVSSPTAIATWLSDLIYKFRPTILYPGNTNVL